METGQQKYRICITFLLLLAVGGFLAAGPAAVSAVDEGEPNDDRDDATSISANETVTGTIDSSDDVDWIAFDVQAGETINVTATFADGGTNEIELQRENGGFVDNFDGSGTTGSLGGTATESGTYYLRIVQDGNSGADYTVDVRTFETDDFEPNEQLGEATNISVNTTQSGTITITDQDWFAFEAQAGETINVTATFGDDGRNEVEIQNSNGGDIAQFKGSGTTGSAGATVTESGTYYLRVNRDGPQGTDYTLDVRTYRTDDFESNENRGDATQIGSNGTQSGTISIGDQDWFAFDAQAGQTINMTVTAGDDGRNDVELFNDRGGELAQVSRVKNETRSGGTTARYTGTYYVQVRKEGPEGASYTLNLSTYRTDRFEPNERRENATSVSPPYSQRAMLSQGDRDWYAVDAREGNPLNVTLRSGADDTNRVELFDNESGEVADGRAFSNGSNTVGTIADYNGTYYALVTSESGYPNGYGIEFSAGTSGAFEPNENRGEATELTPNVSFDNTTISIGDVDWYKFEASAGETIDVRSTIDADGKNEIEIRNGNGGTLAAGSGSGETVRVGATAPESGTYYLVVSKDGPSGTDYTLDLRTYETDDFEANERQGTATTLTPNATESGRISIGDQDWFALDADAGETINVTNTIGDDGENELELFDEDGREFDQFKGSDTTGSLGTTVPESGTYYVRVSKDGPSGASYTLDVRTYETDDFEPNERLATATTLSPNATESGRISIGDQDWFEIDAEAGETINVTATIGEDGQNQVTLFNEDGGDITDFDGSGTTGSLGTTARYSGTYYVLVERDGPTGASYNLDVRTYETDPFEPNERRSTATTIDANATQSGTISIGDRDWFAVETTAGETINVTATTGEDGQNRIEVFNEDGNEVSEAVGRPGTTRNVGTTARYTGTYYVYVSREGPQGADYTLDVRTYETDPFEPNEARATATDLGTGGLREGTISLGDVDWFAVDGQRGETVNVTVASDGDDVTDVELFDSTGTDIATRTARPDSPVSVGTTVRESSTYYVRVDSDGRTGGDYTLDARTYSTDRFEPNEDRPNATPLFRNPFDPTAPRISLGDDDWFAHVLERGETLDVTVTSTADGRNVDLVVRNPEDDLSTERTIGPGETATVSHTAQVAGTHHIGVDASPPTNYTFAVTGPSGERLGPPNDYAELGNPPVGNTDRPSATRLPVGEAPVLGMVDDDEDYFKVNLVPNDRLLVNASFEHDSNDLTVELLDQDGSPVRTANSSTDNESIDYTTDDGGRYYVRITGEAGEQSTYRLESRVDTTVGVALAPNATDGETLRVGPDNTTTVDLLVENASARGVGSYNVTLESSDDSVVAFTDASIVSDDAIRQVTDGTVTAASGSLELRKQVTITNASVDGESVPMDGRSASVDGATVSIDGATISVNDSTTTVDATTVSEENPTVSVGGATVSVEDATVTVLVTSGTLTPASGTVDLSEGRTRSAATVTSVTVSNGTLETDNTSAVPEGTVDAANRTVTITDGSVTFPASDVSVSEDTVTVAGIVFDQPVEENPFVAGTLTLETGGTGTASLGVGVDDVHDQQDQSYPLGRQNPLDVNVTTEPAPTGDDETPTDEETPSDSTPTPEASSPTADQTTSSDGGGGGGSLGIVVGVVVVVLVAAGGVLAYRNR